MTDRIRITGGSQRGRKLVSPPKNTIRPASDLIRQAVFNMIRPILEESIFFDIFAGTGVVGLEAISRGARRSVFVERDPKNVQLIRRNLELCQLGSQAGIRTGDAFAWGRHFVPTGERTIVFLGPPYPLFAEDADRMLELIREIQGKLQPEDCLVLQYPRSFFPERLPGETGWIKQRHYGKTRIGIWRKPAADGSILPLSHELDESAEGDAFDEEGDGGESPRDEIEP